MNDDEMVKALLAQQEQGQQPPAAPQNPFMPDPSLENRVAGNTLPMHPLVAALMHHSGLLNLIRNSQNQKQAVLQDLPK